MLTDKQFRHYRTFGFVVLRDFFTPQEVETLRAEYEAELDRVYAHAPFTGEKRYWTTMLHPRTPLYSSLLEDERFCSVAEQLYGDDVIGIGTDANRYVGDTRWHPDHHADPDEDCYGVKFAFYLDPVGADSGALRVIPGSHNRHSTTSSATRWSRWSWRWQGFRPTCAPPTPATWSPSTCAAGTPATAAPPAAACPPACTTTIRTGRWRRRLPASAPNRRGRPRPSTDARGSRCSLRSGWPIPAAVRSGSAG